MKSVPPWEYYDDDTEDGYSICKICKAKLRNERVSNLKRHLRTMHQIDLGSQKDVATTSKATVKGEIKRSKDISLNRVLRSFVGMVTEDNVPITVLNSPNLSKLMDPICKRVHKQTGKRIRLNVMSCKNSLQLVAEEVRNLIKEDLKHKLLSFRVSSCVGIAADNTYLISVNLFKEEHIHSLPLGLINLKENSPLSDELISILHKYDIDINQVVAITVENKTNLYLTDIATSFENASELPLEDIQTTTCAISVANLCCQDVANNEEIKRNLQICRSIAHFLENSIELRRKLEEKQLCVPQLDIKSSGLSTYAMVQAIQSARMFLNDSAVISMEEFNITSVFWDFVDSFIDAMGPMQRTIIRYQDEMHYSDVYAQWLKCKLLTENIVEKNASDDNNYKYKIGDILLQSMAHRSISNKCLNTCLFLDPRFHRTLSTIQKTEAICFLKQLWDKMGHINLVNSVIDQYQHVKPVENAETEDQLLDTYLSGSINHEQALDSLTVYTTIDCLKLPYMKSDTDVLKFWEGRKHIEPELYQLSNICFAIPPTQMMSNLFLSKLKLVVESNRDCDTDTLENILLTKLNPTCLRKTTVDSLHLFENSNNEKSDVHKDPLSTFKDDSNSWPDLEGNSFENDDGQDNTFSNDDSEECFDEINVKKEKSSNCPAKRRKLSTDINKMSITDDMIDQYEDLEQGNDNNQESDSESMDDQSWHPGQTNATKRRHNTNSKQGKTKGGYLCVTCGKKFISLHSLKTHMQRHVGDKKYKCPQCPKSFVCSSGLYTHVKIHSNDKPHVCSICSRGFRTKYELKHHNRYHTGEKNYPCEHCNLRFMTSEKQRRHMRTHTGEKPYSCQYCDRSFAQSNDRNKHLKQHLGENIFQCELCPLRFPLVRDLRVHLTTHKDDDEETRARNLQAREEDEKNNECSN